MNKYNVSKNNIDVPMSAPTAPQRLSIAEIEISPGELAFEIGLDPQFKAQDPTFI